MNTAPDIFDQAHKSISESLIRNYFDVQNSEVYQFKGTPNLKTLCPFRQDKNIGSFSINLNNGMWYDNSPAAIEQSGDFIKLVSLSYSLTLKEAAEKIIKDSNGKLPEEKKTEKKEKNYKAVIPIPEEKLKMLNSHVKLDFIIDKYGKPKNGWKYRDPDGKAWMCITRHIQNGNKNDIPYHYCTDNKWHAGCLVEKNRHLYNIDKVKPDSKIIIAEGNKCADVKIDGYISVTWWGGGNQVDRYNWQALKDIEDIIIWPDYDVKKDKHGNILKDEEQPGLKAALQIQEKLKHAKILNVYDYCRENKKPDTWDIADAKEDGIDLFKFIDECPRIKNIDNENLQNEIIETRGRKKNSKLVLEILTKFEVCHFAGRAYLLFNNQALEIGSTQYKDFIQRIAYTEKDVILSDNQVKEVVSTQRGSALFVGKEIPVYVRIAAPTENIVYIDLNDRENNIIEITPEGWHIVEKPDIHFFRPPHLKALPTPEHKGDIQKLKDLFGLMDEKDFILLRSVLCFWMRGRPGARGTSPILNFAGPAGSGKTIKAKLLKYLIDPGTPEARTPTKEPRDLYIAAKNLYVLNLDNISSLDPDMQDALCSLASQGGFARKKNYTDDDENIFEECRAVILNGINFKARPDLQSRKIDIELSAIPASERTTENEIWKQAEELRPVILGGLLTALSGALREVKNIDPSKYDLPRLADFALFSIALERGNGWPEGQTIEALEENYSTALFSIAEEGPLVGELLSFVKEKKEWTGRPSELLEELNNQVDDKIIKKRTWPDNASILSRQIQRNIDVLQNMNISVMKARGSKSERLIILKYKEGETDEELLEIPF